MPAPTTTLAAFDSFVLPFAPGVPLPFARKAVRLAASEFCEKTRCWREIVTVAVDERNETIVVPAHAAVHRIEEATFEGGVILKPIQFTDTTLMQRAENAQPKYIAQTNPNTVALIPFALGTLTLSVFLKPTPATNMQIGANGEAEDAYDLIPEFMFNQYAQAIADGALARILITPGQPFTSPQEGLRRGLLFREACDSNFAGNITMQNEPPSRTRLQEY